MSLKAAASGFVIFLLSVPVVQGKNGWGVTYTSTEICALEGSAVDISCTYRYPSNEAVVKEMWFIKKPHDQPMDLLTDSDYTSRLDYNDHDNRHTLRITDLRKNDSVIYKFRFVTNNDAYTGLPGVTLSVTDPELQVQVERSSARLEVKCYSRCFVPDTASYVWYINGQKMDEETSSQRVSVNDHGNYSCAVKGYEDYSSPPVYILNLPTVLVSPSGEIVEGSPVALTCSSDANPAPTYMWYKENGNPDLHLPSEEPLLFFRSIESSDSGEYYCMIQNKLGGIKSESILIDVKYAPRLPSVSVSPSAEIMEGSSVTLTCSSDANPAATYTWYKEDEDSPKASGQIFTITDFRPEHSGNYYCEAQNRRGRHNSTLHLIVVAGVWTLIEVGTITAILTVIILFFVLLWISFFAFISPSRKKMAPKRPSEPIERPDKNAQEQPPEHKDNLHYASIRFCKRQEDPLYANTRPAHLQRHRREEDAGSVMYATVKFTNDSPAPKSQETGADPAASNSAENHENQNV
ncbi:B-cell receptor CD22-like [Dicentrarchus labrax]|uniref:B-cell receptor CD22-like n=1 Tax=Dicentrarchus labrax TaxID=13489 RepID=UPI0021F50616|nr:B-cell receptor CD22-like [Dicentrarchus labrax]